MKTNYISDATKILLLAATTMITCVIVWLGFHALNIAKDISTNATSQMSELNEDIVDSDILKFDKKMDVAGSEVVNFIKQYLGEYEDGEKGSLYVTVTQGSLEYTYKNGIYISNIRDFTDAHYIDPVAAFSGDVIRNKNDVIIGVAFTKQ
jgi:hypothetical protein